MKKHRPEVLVVDDDSAAAQMLQLRLSRAGYIAHVAYDGQSAIRIFDESRPQWVFLDASMPEVSGLEVCQHIRQNDPEHAVKVVFVSGAEMPSQSFVRNCATWSGADHFISKPYDAWQIVELMRCESRPREARNEEAQAAHRG